MKVVSLLPAATEIVAALGAAEQLVEISPKCDHPPPVITVPRVTCCKIHGRDSAGHERVACALIGTGQRRRGTRRAPP